MIEFLLRIFFAADRSRPLLAHAASASQGRMRAPPINGDRVMLSDTHHWLRRVPPRIHPKHLCRYHPHLANRLAQCWGDRNRVEQFVDDLLVDRRGGRKGLSTRVAAELLCLERFHAQHMTFKRPRSPLRSQARLRLANVGAAR